MGPDTRINFIKDHPKYSTFLSSVSCFSELLNRGVGIIGTLKFTGRSVGSLGTLLWLESEMEEVLMGLSP